MEFEINLFNHVFETLLILGLVLVIVFICYSEANKLQGGDIMAVEFVTGCFIGYVVGVIKEKMHWIEKFLTARKSRLVLNEEEEEHKKE